MNHYQKISDKIYLPADLLILRQEWRQKGLKVVFTNGCFDLIHLGHIDYLSKAADLGDKLIIAINSDHSVRLLKGKTRPLQNEQTRLMVMAAFSFADAVVLFNEETPYKIINLLKPDVLAKGGDYKAVDVVGADIVRDYNGQVIIIPFLQGYSTTSIEEKIKSEDNN